jgi:hypothetical protein
MSVMSTLPPLFRLPTSILSVILSKYLTIDTVCVFDTAVSEKRSRQILLNLLLSAEVVFEDTRDRDGRDFLSWSKERGLVLSEDSIDQYRQHAQPSRDAEGFFSWLQKRSVSVKHVNLVFWQNISDAGMRVLGESSCRLESLTM